MSQYPSPYMPPNVSPYYGAPPDPLAPAKKASVLMFIVGPVVLLMGGCLSMVPSLLSAAPPEQVKQLYDQFQNAYHISPTEMNSAFVLSGVLMILAGLAMLILAFFVRRGGRIATILSMIISGLVIFNSAGGLLLAFVHLTDANALGGLCTNTFVVGIFGLLFYWLRQGLKALGNLRRAQQQYHAQYMQYQQNMQAYMGYAQQQQMQPPPMGYPPQGGQGYAQAPAQQQPAQLPNPMTPSPQPENPGTPPQQ